MPVNPSFAHQSQEPFLGVEGFGIPLKFDNASDYLVARLFLTDDKDTRIPWKYCNTILSMFQDPRFDSRKVSFKDFGDMTCRIGEYRDEAWSLVETRAQGTTAMPQVVLDGVFDVLKFELEAIGSHWITKNSNVRHLVKNMSLVHSSWHGTARRTLGNIVSFRWSSGVMRNPNAIQDPSIGRWTRTLDLEYLFFQEEEYTSWLHSVIGLRHLCHRISGVRNLSLSLMPYAGKDSKSFPDGSLETFYQWLSPLKDIEELTLEAPWHTDSVPSNLLRLVAETHRKLGKLCFKVQSWNDVYKKYKFPESLTPLASLSNLHSIHISRGYGLGGQSPPHITEIIWSRGSSELDTFIPNEVRVKCLSDSGVSFVRGSDIDITEDPGLREMLQTVSFIDLFVSQERRSRDSGSPDFPSEGEVALAIAHILKWSSSVLKLLFRGFPWSHAKMFGMLDVPSSVRELLVVSSPPLPSPEDDLEETLEICAFPSYDEQLAQALGAWLAPGLRVLNVLLTEHFLFEDFLYRPGRETFTDCARNYAEAVLGKATAEELKGPDLYVHLLPLCKQKCAERGIAFRVDIDCGRN